MQHIIMVIEGSSARLSYLVLESSVRFGFLSIFGETETETGL